MSTEAIVSMWAGRPAESEPSRFRSSNVFGAEVTGVCSTRNIELVARRSANVCRSLDDLRTLGAMIAVDEVTWMIDRTFSLADTAAALAHVGAGHTRGKSVIVIRDAD
jgi:NADPH:quinone reductase-like Zn-dependent oxidoreductase